MLDSSYEGPALPSEDGGKTFHITLEFVEAMIAWFKDCKALPRRYVWEIILGAYDAFRQEQSLVDLPLDTGLTCDVIGDVHGMCS